MGYYIEVPENHQKAEQLIKLYGASIVPCPEKFEDIPDGKALICVVQNYAFDAAGYCYCPGELFAFREDFRPRQRPRKWLYMDKPLAEKLSGYKR